MLNSVCITGRLTRDPELRFTQSNVAVVSLRLAVDRDYRGEKNVDYFDVVAWRGLAENCSQYLIKGSLVDVEGKLQTRDWTDKDGKKRTAIEIQADNVHFLADLKPKDGAAREEKTYSYFDEIDDTDSELPF